MTDGATPAPGRLVIRAGSATDTGRTRTNNQDSHALFTDRGLWVLADGMGGAQGGEVASKLAVDTIDVRYAQPGQESILAAFAAANDAILEASDAPDLRGMGTTTVAAVLLDDDESTGEAGAQHLLVLNVGDSRAYLFRDGALTQITEDHSLVAELVREGRITEAEAEVHPQRNVITRVMGVFPQVDVDMWPVDPVRGDRLLLCSDGLFNEVGTNQIEAVLRRLGDPGDAAAELVRLANEAGGRDNITVIVIDVLDDGGVAGAASAALADEGPRGRTPRAAHQADLAGFTTAPEPGEGLSDDELDALRDPAGAGGSRRDRRRAGKATRGGRTRLTWRTLGFALLVVAVLGGAFATIQWYGTSTYYVGFDGDEVTIYQGRPGGLLWIDPELETGTGIMREEVPSRYLDDLAAGHQQPSLARARRYVSNIERDIAEMAEAAEAAERARTTTTTAPAATTSTETGTPAAPN